MILYDTQDSMNLECSSLAKIEFLISLSSSVSSFVNRTNSDKTFQTLSGFKPQVEPGKFGSNDFGSESFEYEHECIQHR